MSSAAKDMVSTEPPRFLLLLPPIPTPPTLPALRAAFGDTISQVLKEVASHSSQARKAAVLEIAVACPHLVRAHDQPRSTLYSQTQAVVSGVYKLVVVTAAKDDINVEDSDGVDVRVITVAWSPEQDDQGRPFGPVISLHALACSARPWQYAFGVESELGGAFVQGFITAKGGEEQISQAQGGSVMNTGNTRPKEASTSAHTPGPTASAGHESRHNHVAVGGTFDHIHIGHKLLLNMTLFAVDASEDGSAVVGVTGDELLKNKKHAQVLESWDDRQGAARDFVEAILNFRSEPVSVTSRNDSGPNGKSIDVQYPGNMTVKFTEIQDPFGPTITEEQIGALIISAETRAGGKAVNDKRQEKGWKALEVLEVDVLDADEGGSLQEGFDSKISSTAIREKIARKLGKL